VGQVKKSEVKEAILASAHRLFGRNGYNDTSIARIAADAGISTANVYVYFRSKIEILYAIYDPWMRARLSRLERDLARIRDPRRRLKKIFRTLWRDIPAEDNGFANNIMQAISTATPGEGYKPTLLRWMEQKLAEMVTAALPAHRRSLLGRARIAHLMVMAFDGFIVYHHLNPAGPCDGATIDYFCSLLLGDSAASPRRARY